MALPERRYYTLDKAIKVIGNEIEFSDLIHFASIGLLQLCIKIPAAGFHFFNENDEVFKIEIESNSTLWLEEESRLENEAEIKKIIDEYGKIPDKNSHLSYRYFHYSSDYFSITEAFDNLRNEKKIDKIDGLVAIPHTSISSDELDIVNEVTDIILVDSFDIPRCENFKKTSDYAPSDFYLSDWYEAKVKDLLITDHELSILMDGGHIVDEGLARNNSNIKNSRYEKKTKNKERTTANQATYIKFLLLLSGFTNDELRQSPQTLLDLISKKSIAAGIEMPVISDNTMKDWLSRARDIQILQPK